MKKLALTTLIGLFSIMHSANAIVPDLREYGYESTKEKISGASHIIRYAGLEKTATLKDENTYNFEIDDIERQNLADIGSAIGGFSNKNVTTFLKCNELNLDRQGTTFTLSYQDLTATFKMIDSLIYGQFQKLIPTPYDGQPFMQQTSLNFREYLKGNDAGTQVMKLIVDHTLRLAILHRIYVYRDYINNPHARADTIEDIVQKVGKWESDHDVYKTPVYAAYIGWKNAKPETIAWILEDTHTIFPAAQAIYRNNLKEVYSAYMARDDADEAVIAQYNMRDFVPAK